MRTLSTRGPGPPEPPPRFPDLTSSRLVPALQPQTSATALAAQRAAFRTVFPGVMVAMFLAAIDQTILAAAIPAIAGSLGNLADVSWLAAAYLIAATITAPIYGHLGDRFGRRRMLFVALSLFVLASIACASAQTLGMLIAARAFQGLGGGGLMTLSQALISEQVPPRERGRYQGYFASLFALSSTLGPVMGGYLTQHASWRSVFLINLPLGVVAALLARRIPRTPPHRGGPFRPDVLGTALFALGACTFLFTVSSAGHRIPWTSPMLPALVLVSAASFVALTWWELRTHDPVIPVRLLMKPEILRTNAMVLTFGASLFALVLYLPLYLQLGRAAGVGESGVLLLPITLTLAVASSLTGRTIARRGLLAVLPTVGLSVTAIAFGVLALTLQDLPTPIVMVLVVVGSAGLGTVMPTSQVVVQEAAGPAALGSATASVSVSRSFGGSIGAALVGALLFLMVGAGNDPALHATLARVGDEGAQLLGALPAEQRTALVARLGTAFQAVFGMIAAVAAIGAAFAYSVPRRRL